MKKLMAIFMVMAITIFAVSAETVKLGDGEYFIKNKQIPGYTYYTPKAELGCSTLVTVFSAIKANGKNYEIYCPNVVLDPEVAALTKKVGVTYLANTSIRVLNIYDTESDCFITLIWNE